MSRGPISSSLPFRVRRQWRKRLWRVHAWLGLVAGLGLLVLGLSGSLLVFHEELADQFSPAVYRVHPTREGRLPLDGLLARAQEQLPNHEITGWNLQPDGAGVADDLYVIRHGDNVWLTATLDPYTGRLLSEPHLGRDTLRGWLLKLHTEFFAGAFGVGLTGLLGAILCVLGVTGVWIYREFWRHLFTLRWGRSARLLFSDVHKFVGITSAVLQLILGFTGAFWNLTQTVEHLGGEVEQPRIEGRLYPATLSLAAMVRDGEARLPGFKAHFLSLPSVPSAPAVMLWGAVEPRPLLANAFGSTLTYDSATGAHCATNDLRAAGTWRRIKDTFQPLHFGNFGGLAVKCLWALAGLAPGILGVTGFLLWRLRHRHAPGTVLAAPAPFLP